MFMNKPSSKDRDSRVYLLLNELFEEAENSEVSFVEPFHFQEVESLFSSTVWGFRELFLTILVARLLNPKYRASKDLYACNPRPLFEHSIRAILMERGIPTKKSGPLNVAKNTKKINEDWAANKRGDHAAMNVVNLVKKIEAVSPSTLKELAIIFLKRYLTEAKTVEKLRFSYEIAFEDPVSLFYFCKEFILKVPDGGTSPQKVCGLLIETLNLERESFVEVFGVEDSVSTTNTTSKKAGDILEKFPNGQSIVYEITVKAFDGNRIRDSYEALKSRDTASGLEVLVVCRESDLPKNIDLQNLEGKNGLLASYVYEDLIYYFLDMDTWIAEKLFSLSKKGRGVFFAKLVDHVNDPNTSLKVKEFFARWREGNP